MSPRTRRARQLLTVVGTASLWAGILHADDAKPVAIAPPERPANLSDAVIFFDPLIARVQDVTPVVPGVPAPQSSQSGLGLSADIQQALNTSPRSSSTGSLAGSGASAERVAAADSAASTGVVGGSQSQFLASTDAGDLLSRGGTGIEAQRRSPVATEPRIRGYRLGQISTWSDGAYWFPARNDLDTFLSKIDSGNIRDALVIKGPYAARYGPGFSFIDIATNNTPRYENGTEWHGITATTYKGNGEQLYGRQTVFGGSSDWGARLSYGHRTGNDYTMGNGDELPSSYNVRDIDFAMGFDLSPNSSVEIGYVRLDQTGLEFPGQVFDTNLLITDGWRGRYSLNNQRYFDHFEVSGWYNQTTFKGDSQASGKRRQIPELDLSGFTGFTNGQTSTGGAQSLMSWGRATEAQLTVGTDYRYLSQQLNEFDSLFSIPCDLNYPVPRTVQQTVGLFFENRNPVNDRLVIKIGGRVDFMNSNVTRVPDGFGIDDCGCGCDHFANVEDALGVSSLRRDYTLWLSYINGEYKLNDNLTALFGAGFSMRPPTPTELYAVGPFLASLQQGFTSVVGNPLLDPEKLYQVDIGLKGNFERFRAGVNLFHAWVNDYVTFEALGDVQGKIVLGANNALQVRFVNTGLATLYGGEAYAEYDAMDILTPFATATYVRAQDQTRGSRGNPGLGLPAPDSEPLPNIAPLDVRLGVRLHEPCQNSRYGVDVIWRLVAQQREVAASLLEQQTPGFQTWDVRGYWQYNEQVLITAGIENVFDKFYREHLDLRTGLGVFQPGRNAYVGLEVRY
jgi:iron complex outermembrane receptor protein